MGIECELNVKAAHRYRAAVRVERVSDWRLVRDIRLRALRSDAHAFDGDLHKEAARHEAYWRSATQVTTWVAAFIGEAAVGIARAVGEPR